MQLLISVSVVTNLIVLDLQNLLQLTRLPHSFGRVYIYQPIYVPIQKGTFERFQIIEIKGKYSQPHLG